MKQLSLSDYRTDLQKFYNHAFAVFDVAPEKITVSYYEYPSWGVVGGPPSDPEIGGYLYQEDVPQARP
jgi:hypothetical protein